MPVANLSHRAKYRLTGGDRVRYLNGQVTANVARLKTGETGYALVPNIKGKLEGDVYIHAREADLLIDAPGELRDALFGRLGKYIIADDCELEDVTDDFPLFHELGTGAVNRYGVPGRDLWLPAGEAGPQADLTAESLDLLRLEHGVPAWGAELGPDVFPQEAGLEDRAVDFHKGCYIGQEIISRLKSVGRVNRLLLPLEAVSGGAELAAGHRLFLDGAEAGVVTSVRFHPGWQKTIAMGFVKRTLAGPEAVFHAGPEKNLLSSTVKIRKIESQ